MHVRPRWFGSKKHSRTRNRYMGVINLWELFHGPNAGYALELYDRYLQDPDAVDPATRALFAQLPPGADDGASAAPVTPAPPPSLASGSSPLATHAPTALAATASEVGEPRATSKPDAADAAR